MLGQIRHVHIILEQSVHVQFPQNLIEANVAQFVPEVEELRIVSLDEAELGVRFLYVAGEGLYISVTACKARSITKGQICGCQGIFNLRSRHYRHHFLYAIVESCPILL